MHIKTKVSFTLGKVKKILTERTTLIDKRLCDELMADLYTVQRELLDETKHQDIIYELQSEIHALLQTVPNYYDFKRLGLTEPTQIQEKRVSVWGLGHDIMFLKDGKTMIESYSEIVFEKDSYDHVYQYVSVAGCAFKPSTFALSTHQKQAEEHKEKVMNYSHEFMVEMLKDMPMFKEIYHNEYDHTEQESSGKQ